MQSESLTPGMGPFDDNPRQECDKNNGQFLKNRIQMATIAYCGKTGEDIAMRYTFGRANLQSAVKDHDYLEEKFLNHQIDQSTFDTKEEAIKIEKQTRLQSKCQLWQKQRKFRLTASKFGEICKFTDKIDVFKLCQSIFGDVNFTNNATTYGLSHESEAIKAVETSRNLIVKPMGLVIHPDLHFLGASPDGEIQEEGTLVEVKCPFNGRNEQIVPGKNFSFLSQENTLKRTHDYYYQAQGQLGIAKREKCYFIVYTKRDIFIKEIFFDEVFFEEQMLPRLLEFYYGVFREYCASQLQVSKVVWSVF